MGDQDDHILITKENLDRFGFSCFFYEEEKPTKDFFIRELVLAIGGKNGNLIRKFRIPSSLVIQLSKQLKITNKPGFQIGIDSTAVNAIKLLSERAGWNQSETDLKLMVAHEPENIFLATYTYENHRITLGSGVSLSVNEKMCWIGMILVHPELRRQGIARSIMHTCLTHARKVQQKSIIGLDATPEGKQVYEALGFKDSFTIWRSVISTHLKKDQLSTNKATPFDLDLIASYLKTKNYTERIQMIAMLEKLPEVKNILFLRNGEVQGFAMSRPGRLKPFIGPLIADNCETAKILLMNLLQHWSKAGYEEVLMDIPDMHIGTNTIFVNKQGKTNAVLKQIPVEPVRSFMRMYQLISANDENTIDLDQVVRRHAIQNYKLTLNFMNKERSEIAPMMFGTAGPEWS